MDQYLHMVKLQVVKHLKCYSFSIIIDHKPEIPSELKRIEKAGKWVSDGWLLGNLNLNRGLGDSEYKID